MVRTQGPAGRRPGPARALPPPRGDREAHGRPGARRGPVAGADRGRRHRGAGRIDPRPVGAARLEPVPRRRPAGAAGALAAPGRCGRGRLLALPRGAPQAHRARTAGVRRRARGPAAGRRRRAARRLPEQLRAVGGLDRGRRLRAALVDDPARARQHSARVRRGRQPRADVPAALGLLPRHPRAAAPRGALRRPHAARYRCCKRRRRRARVRPGGGCIVGGRAAGGLRARSVRRGGSREVDPPVHRGVEGGARAPDRRAAGARAGLPPVRRGVGLGTGRRAAA